MSFFYLAIFQSLLFSLVSSQSCSSQTGVKLTFYGFPDGMSDTTSFGCDGTTPLPTSESGTAGGDGSYSNPETFATAMTNTNFKQCEIVYIPYFQKYFQYMDHCEAAIADYAAGLTHLDLWIGPQSDQGQLPSGALVEGSTCYNTASGGRIFPTYDASSFCSATSSSGTGSGSSSPASSPSSTPPAPSVTPSITPLTVAQPEKVAVKPVAEPVPTSSPAPVAALPVVQDAVVHNNAPVVQAPAPTTMMTMASSSTAVAAPATSTSAAAVAAGPVTGSSAGKISGPKLNWNSGMSYADQIAAEMAQCASWNACLGDTCSGYNGCAGEWICLNGKCHDNKTD